jgi:hypothetical protein
MVLKKTSKDGLLLAFLSNSTLLPNMHFLLSKGKVIWLIRTSPLHHHA